MKHIAGPVWGLLTQFGYMNLYVIDRGESAVVVDTGTGAGMIDGLAAGLPEMGKSIDDVSHILITHENYDHVGGLAELKAETAAPIYIHPEAVDMLASADRAAQRFQLNITPPPPADHMLAEGDVIDVGNLRLEVLYTPGHAPGHVSFYLRAHNVIFDGDVLFEQSIGRTDLPGGDMAPLMASIRDKLLPLPDETQVLSGHGRATIIGREKQTNPFLTGRFG